MVVSGYFFHAMKPITEPGWLISSEVDPCGTDLHQTINIFGRKLAKGDTAHLLSIASSINDTIANCYKLANLARGAHNVSIGYNTMLNTLGRQDGLTLEASRAILNNQRNSRCIRCSRGDIMRMGANAIYESETSNRMSKRVFMSDFPIGDLATFTNTSTKLLQFLMQGTKGAKHPFWSCFNVSTAVDSVVKFAFVNADSANHDPDPHITQQLISKTEREEMKLHLEASHTVGPLLRLVQKALMN
jgi:hypothetical protein